MKENLLNILADPIDLNPLYYNAGQEKLHNADHTHSYKIVDSVPVLLPFDAQQQIRQSEHHQRLNSQFRYVDHYQKDAELFDYFEEFTDGATQHENRRLHETILSELPKNIKNVLDVGSGNAWVAQSLCKKSIDVVSFDISIENTTRALKKYPHTNHFAVMGDAYTLPFKDNSFDAIISAEVIEHVPEPTTFIQNLFRVVKPGGTIIISTPYNEVIPYYLCVHCNKPTPQHAHLHSFTEKKILSIVADDITTSKKAYAFSNKALAKLRTHVLFKYFPFSVWSVIDKLANKIINKPSRLLFKIVKK